METPTLTSAVESVRKATDNLTLARYWLRTARARYVNAREAVMPFDGGASVREAREAREEYQHAVMTADKAEAWQRTCLERLKDLGGQA